MPDKKKDIDVSEILAEKQKKDRVLNHLRKTGIPLELESQKIMTNNGFEKAYSYLYRSKDENGQIVNRELDILASKTVDKSNKFVDLKIDVNIFGSCKYRKDYSYFLFEGSNPSTIQKFPIIRGPSIFKFPIFIDVNKLGFPITVYHNIKGCLTNELENPNKDFDDQEVYASSNECLSAVEEIYSSERLKYDEMLSQQVPNGFSSIISSFLREKGFMNEALFSNNVFIEKNRELLDFLSKNKPFIKFNIGFLMAITEGNILKVKVDENNNPIDMEHVGYGLYLHRPQVINKWKIMEDVPLLPIIFTEKNKIVECIKIINKISNDEIQRICSFVTARNYETLIKYFLKCSML